MKEPKMVTELSEKVKVEREGETGSAMNLGQTKGRRN